MSLLLLGTSVYKCLVMLCPTVPKHEAGTSGIFSDAGQPLNAMPSLYHTDLEDKYCFYFKRLSTPCVDVSSTAEIHVLGIAEQNEASREASRKHSMLNLHCRTTYLQQSLAGFCLEAGTAETAVYVLQMPELLGCCVCLCTPTHQSSQ